MKPSPTVDLADLVSAAVSLRSPSRDIDSMVHALLAGRTPKSVARPEDVRLTSWIASETPAYTAGGPQVHVLATRLGATLEIEKIDGGYRAFARRPADGHSARAAAPIEGAAACAALAALVGTRP